MNLPMTAPTGDKGTTETGRRFAARGIITRHAGRQTMTLIGAEGGLAHSGALVEKGDTRRQAEARIAAAGGAR